MCACLCAVLLTLTLSRDMSTREMPQFFITLHKDFHVSDRMLLELLSVSRSQAEQGPEALPEPEVSEVLPGSRAAEDHPSQSVSPCCAL